MYTLLTPKAYQYNRLESRPRTAEFDRALKAEIADPLWMLTRQWQFGEFKGEDTGSSIFAKVQVTSSKLTHFSGDNGQNIHDITDALPLEAQVEGIRPEFDLKMSLQLASYWKKLLKSKGLGAYYNDFKASFPLADPSIHPEEFAVHSNGQMKSLMKMAAPKAMDGVAFYNVLKYDRLLAGNLIPTPNTTLEHKQISAAGYDLLALVDELYVMPEEESETWKNDRLEYSFQTGIEQNDGTTDALETEEYYLGELDWFNFDLNKSELAGVKHNLGGNGSNTKILSTMLLPTQARFPGMPASRWWEFEDGRINFGKMDMNEADLGKLLLAQFGLMYSNDWSMIPLRVPVGSLSEVDEIVVTDVFGQKTIVQSAANHELGDATQEWGMFNLSTVNPQNGAAGMNDNRLLIPATPAKPQESEPIEEIKFLRDEMANMVWGIEKIIPDGLGSGRDGKIAGQMKRKWLSKNLAPKDNLKSGLIYELISSDVPENWIPFMPVKVSEMAIDQIRLQRGKLKRKIEGQVLGEVLPQTRLLSPVNLKNQYQSLYLKEEEIPKAGITVKSTYQRVRWYDGKIVLWYGRSKKLSRSEGASGMTFDKLKPNTDT